MSEADTNSGSQPRKDILEVLAEIRADQIARGHVPRTVEEIEAERRAFREDSEEEMQAVERLYEESERACQQTPPREPPR